MARLALGQEEFDEVEASTGSTGGPPIPDGRYALQVVDSDLKDTSSGGTMVAVTMEVHDGEYKGRKIFDNFNIINKSDVAQRIGRSQFKALYMACGFTQAPSDTQELHYQPFDADVVTEPASTGKDGKEYKERNKIQRYIFSEEQANSPPAKSAPPKTAPAAAPAARPAARPWQK